MSTEELLLPTFLAFEIKKFLKMGNSFDDGDDEK